MFIYLALFFLLSIVPIIWCNYIFNKYDKVIPDMPFDGHQFGKILIKELNLKDVCIEATSIGDHYDLEQKKVRVNNDRLKKKSLTSISVICHEIGHAIQHSQNYSPLVRRNILVKNTEWINKLNASLIYVGLPTILALGFSSLIKICIIMILLSLLIGFVIHLLTLEVELDASFKRAYPILKRMVPKNYHSSCHAILKAAAFTYLIGVFRNLISLRVIWSLISKMRF